jgi:hypothetical protein
VRTSVQQVLEAVPRWRAGTSTRLSRCRRRAVIVLGSPCRLALTSAPLAWAEDPSRKWPSRPCPFDCDESRPHPARTPPQAARPSSSSPPSPPATMSSTKPGALTKGHEYPGCPSTSTVTLRPGRENLRRGVPPWPPCLRAARFSPSRWPLAPPLLRGHRRVPTSAGPPTGSVEAAPSKTRLPPTGFAFRRQIRVHPECRGRTKGGWGESLTCRSGDDARAAVPAGVRASCARR